MRSGLLGTPMWKLTIEDDQASKTVVHLVRDDYSIGRAEENTVRLTERNISRRHARLTKPGEHWVLFDLSSYNGCYVNGQRVSGQQEIVHGDLVQLGDYRLQVIDDSIAEPAPFDKAVTMPAAPRSQALMHQPDRLVMVVGPSVGAEFPLTQDRPLVIGRGEECEVPINHPSVSRVHAEIQPLGDGRYEIVDRESANGVRVNGVELPRTLLDARDVVELGDVILKFIPAGDIYVPGAEESQQLSALTLAGTAVGAESPFGGSKWSTGMKLGVVGGALAVLLALGVALATRGGSSSQPEIAAGSAEPVDAAMRTLADAKALLDKGDTDGAAAKAAQIPEDSNARKTADYRQIEGAWADALFAKAGASSDPTQKRAYLDQISRATTVDSIRRKRAANELASLSAGSVDVSDLPAAPQEAPKVAAQPVVHGANAAEPAAAPEPKPAAASATKVASPATLVRKNPFDDGADSTPVPSSAQDLATSGDRSKLMQAKALLQQKAQAGTASDRDLKMLRALCKQLGDASCSN
ncbi:MAG TPA: FHA domain-containing protein [Polyangiaceae bacterium]|jgi:pSer/pThr/pTyr-binding forkhead associated (FHA) protein